MMKQEGAGRKCKEQEEKGMNRKGGKEHESRRKRERAVRKRKKGEKQEGAGRSRKEREGSVRAGCVVTAWQQAALVAGGGEEIAGRLGHKLPIHSSGSA